MVGQYCQNIQTKYFLRVRKFEMYFYFLKKFIMYFSLCILFSKKLVDGIFDLIHLVKQEFSYTTFGSASPASVAPSSFYFYSSNTCVLCTVLRFISNTDPTSSAYTLLDNVSTLSQLQIYWSKSFQHANGRLGAEFEIDLLLLPLPGIKPQWDLLLTTQPAEASRKI